MVYSSYEYTMRTSVSHTVGINDCKFIKIACERSSFVDLPHQPLKYSVKQIWIQR